MIKEKLTRMTRFPFDQARNRRSADKFRREKKAELKRINKIFQVIYQEHCPFEFTIDFQNGTIKTTTGISFYIDSLEPETLVETFGLQLHEKLEAKKGATMLDAGAYFGDTALYFANMGFKVYSIEPNPINYAALVKNLSLNPSLAKHITAHQVAVGKEGTLDFIHHGFEGGGSSYTTRFGDKVKVKSRTFTQILEDFGLKSIDFMKMDCKGAEFYLTIEELNKINKELKIEYTSIRPNDVDELIEKIKKAGFEHEVYPIPHRKHSLSHHGNIHAWRN
jgi:FkbM family methyltransferase